MGVAAAIGGAAVIGAGASIISGNKAANAQKDAARQSAEIEKYMYDTTRADYAPYRDVGQSALYKLADLYGVSRPVGSTATTTTTTPAKPAPGGVWAGFAGAITGKTGSATAAAPSPAMTAGFDDFKLSPGYQFRIDEATKAIERSAAARGGLRSGATMDALQRRVQGVAADEFDTYANRLAALAGVGQTATSGTAAAGAQYASGASNAAMAAGNARASAYANTGNAINQGVGNLASAYLYGQGYGNGGGFGGGAPMPAYAGVRG